MNKYIFDRSDNLRKASSTAYLRLNDVMDSFVAYYSESRLFILETMNVVNVKDEFQYLNNTNSDWKHYIHCLVMENPDDEFDMVSSPFK